MNAKTLRSRAKEIISSLEHCDGVDDFVVRDHLKHPARYLLIGEHPRYGDRHVWGFRHTIQEAATEFFHHEHRPGEGGLMVCLAYIYDLGVKGYMKPIVPGPVEHVVKIGRLVVSSMSGIQGCEFSPGDMVMVRSSGVSPVHFWKGKIASKGVGPRGEKVYMVEFDPWGDGSGIHEVGASRVFRLDPSRELPYTQWNG